MIDNAMINQKSAFKFFILLLLVVLSWYISGFFHIDTIPVKAFLAKFPLFISGLIFILLYCVLTFFIFFSKDILWVASAVLFGPLISSIFIWIAEIINVFILFYLSRILGRKFVENSLDNSKFKELDQRLGNLNIIWLFILRVTPLIPYRFMDMAAGLTRISFRKYLIAAVLGSPLKIFWMQYILAGVGEAILKNPLVAADFFMQHRQVLLFTMIYPVLIIIVLIKFRQKV